ncbi:MAG: hypothetical protein IKB04_05960 [Clostridia bacterium]|nr:hypothetical protein [Clostridia bacterium]
MKKVLSVLAALAAIAGSAYLLYRKFGKPSMVISGEFEDEEPIVMEEDGEATETEEATEE